MQDCPLPARCGRIIVGLHVHHSIVNRLQMFLNYHVQKVSQRPFKDYQHSLMVPSFFLFHLCLFLFHFFLLPQHFATPIQVATHAILGNASYPWRKSQIHIFRITHARLYHWATYHNGTLSSHFLEFLCKFTRSEWSVSQHHSQPQGQMWNLLSTTGVT